MINQLKSLTQEDVLKLLEKPTVEARVEVAEKLTQQYNLGDFSTNEQNLANQIFRYLVRDTEIQIRRVLSENLKANNIIPHDVVLELARDVDEVSIPLLESSDVLNDEDLVDIITQTDKTSHHVAIAQRKTLSEIVSETLIETKNEIVVHAVIQNEGASISDKSYEYIADNMTESKLVMESLLEHRVIPISIQENLMAKVSDEIRRRWDRKLGKETADEVHETIEQSRELVTLNLLKNTHAIDDIKGLVEHLVNQDRLTPSLIIKSLCSGNIRFFEASIAKLADISLSNARTLIEDSEGLGFEAIYKRVGLPADLFGAIKLTLGAAMDVRKEIMAKGIDIIENPDPFYNKLVEELLIRSASKPVENLSTILSHIKQNMNVTHSEEEED